MASTRTSIREGARGTSSWQVQVLPPAAISLPGTGTSIAGRFRAIGLRRLSVWGEGVSAGPWRYLESSVAAERGSSDGGFSRIDVIILSFCMTRSPPASMMVFECGSHGTCDKAGDNHCRSASDRVRGPVCKADSADSSVSKVVLETTNGCYSEHLAQPNPEVS